MRKHMYSIEGDCSLIHIHDDTVADLLLKWAGQ